eukprot:m.234334 g.234334  ORF g.234334 m.234334 type:complete len:867 (+) comp19317_c0_seq2:297-2897(+)
MNPVVPSDVNDEVDRKNTVEEALHFVRDWEDAIVADTAACTAALTAAGSIPGCFALRRGDVCRVLCVVSSERRICHFRLREDAEGVILMDTVPAYTGKPFIDLRSCLEYYLTHSISTKTPNLTQCVPYMPPALPPLRQDSGGLAESTPPRRSNSGTAHSGADVVATGQNPAHRLTSESTRQNSGTTTDPSHPVDFQSSSVSSDSVALTPASAVTASADDTSEVHASVTSQVGERVHVDGYPVAGTLRFMGVCPSSPPFYEGYRCGVELDQPFGKNDGTVQGYAFFVCRPQHGLLVIPDKVTVQRTGMPVRVPEIASKGGKSKSRARTKSLASTRAKSAPTTPNGKGSRSRAGSNAPSLEAAVTTAPPVDNDSEDDTLSLVDGGEDDEGDVQQSLFIVVEGDVQIHIEGKKGWKSYHAVFDVCGKLKYFAKKKSAEVDIAQFGASMDIGPLAFNTKGGAWPKRTNPTCCFLVRIDGGKTLYFITSTDEEAIQWCSALRKFKPQMQINAVPGTMPKELLDEQASTLPIRNSSMVNVEQDLDQTFSALEVSSASTDRAADDRSTSGPTGNPPPTHTVAHTASTRSRGDVNVQDIGALVLCFGGEEDSNSGKLFGVLRFFGPRQPGDSDIVCGVELYEPCGNCDGSSEGQRYFNCGPCFGLILSCDFVQVLPPGTVKPAIEWVHLLETTENTDAALDAIRKGIKNEDPYAALVLGKLYEKGKLIGKNLDLASVNFQKASDYGSSNGMYCLAMKLLKEDTGFSGNFGIRYLDTASVAGNAMARLALAGCCFTGKGNKKGKKNISKGLTVLQNAAMQGFPEAQFQLGQLHNFGLLTVPVNRELAAQWLNVAASQGHSEAAAALSEIQSSSTA